jgi:lipopolysaccharide transport system permease protein
MNTKRIDFKVLRRHIDIVVFHTYSYLKADATRGYLGGLWWVIEPILYMLAFYVVFSIGLRKAEPDFIPFLLIGLTTWKWFATNIQQGSISIKTNIPIMKQVYVPKYIFLYSVILTNTIKFCIVMALLIIFLIIYGINIQTTILALPIIIFCQLVFITGTSGLLSSIVPFLPDLKILIDNVLLFGLFISGIFFDIESMSPSVRYYFELNPMASLIINYRRVLMYGKWPVWNDIALIIFLSLFLNLVSLIIYKKYDRYYLKLSF